jgi:hypothetical protein
MTLFERIAVDLAGARTFDDVTSLISEAAVNVGAETIRTCLDPNDADLPVNLSNDIIATFHATIAASLNLDTSDKHRLSGGTIMATGMVVPIRIMEIKHQDDTHTVYYRANTMLPGARSLIMASKINDVINEMERTMLGVLAPALAAFLVLPNDKRVLKMPLKMREALCEPNVRDAIVSMRIARMETGAYVPRCNFIKLNDNRSVEDWLHAAVAKHQQPNDGHNARVYRRADRHILAALKTKLQDFVSDFEHEVDKLENTKQGLPAYAHFKKTSFESTIRTPPKSKTPKSKAKRKLDV